MQETIDGVSISLEEGEIHAVIGESGGGKSLLAHAILGILPKNAVASMNIFYKNELYNDKLELLRKKHISFVPQSISYLNPIKKTAYYMQELNNNSNKYVEKYGSFGLEKEDIKKFTFQLSGGMARRAMIYDAIMNNKEIIIADEPTPGLNNSLAKEILASLRSMADDGKSILLITHDIDLVMEIADRISVFYGGRIIDTVLAEDFKKGQLNHPYTKAIYDSLPQNEFKKVDMDLVRRECEKLGLPLERMTIKC